MHSGLRLDQSILCEWGSLDDATPCSSALRGNTTQLIALLSDTWFDRSVPAMEPEEMSKFCEHIAALMDEVFHSPVGKKMAVTVVFGMLRSLEWRKHIVPGLWEVLAYCSLIKDAESVRWCLENAIELLEFTRGLADGEGLKWWYWVLWFFYNKLNTTFRDEVKKIAADMVNGGNLSNLNLYLGLIQEEVVRMREEIKDLPDNQRGGIFDRNTRAQLIAMEDNYDQLARIVGRR